MRYKIILGSWHECKCRCIKYVVVLSNEYNIRVVIEE